MKKLLVLAMVIGLLVSGCASSTIFTTKSGSWNKEGMTKIQFKLDCLECRGDYQKADLTNYETDLGFCENEALIRDSHKKQITGWMQVTTWVPFLTLIATPAWVITSLAIPNSDICDRCMKSRGYEKSTPRSGEEFSQCMKNKGYEWKENKGAEEK